mmetsp:Transcript_10164/g.30060  ORF Transcript_10164/g.30060 Transcript_10164/m.30060 type:complete len:501 (+) Transcript_10164:806-2308(+)
MSKVARIVDRQPECDEEGEERDHVERDARGCHEAEENDVDGGHGQHGEEGDDGVEEEECGESDHRHGHEEVAEADGLHLRVLDGELVFDVVHKGVHVVARNRVLELRVALVGVHVDLGHEGDEDKAVRGEHARRVGSHLAAPVHRQENVRGEVLATHGHTRGLDELVLARRVRLVAPRALVVGVERVGLVPLGRGDVLRCGHAEPAGEGAELAHHLPAHGVLGAVRLGEVARVPVTDALETVVVVRARPGGRAWIVLVLVPQAVVDNVAVAQEVRHGALGRWRQRAAQWLHDALLGALARAPGAEALHPVHLRARHEGEVEHVVEGALHLEHRPHVAHVGLAEDHHHTRGYVSRPVRVHVIQEVPDARPVGDGIALRQAHAHVRRHDECEAQRHEVPPEHHELSARADEGATQPPREHRRVQPHARPQARGVRRDRAHAVPPAAAPAREALGPGPVLARPARPQERVGPLHAVGRVIRPQPPRSRKAVPHARVCQVGGRR